MRCVITILLLAIGTCHALAQRPFTRNFWLNEAQLPTKVNAIQQDGYGYIWLGTDNGLYRFNGREIKPVTDSAHKAITALTFDGKHIYAGYADGRIAIIAGMKVIPLRFRGQQPKAAISDMKVDGSGVIWLSTEGDGVFAILNNYALHCNSADGLTDDFVYNISVFPNKHVVVSTDQGINELYFENKILKVKSFSTGDGLPDNIVRTIKPMPDNTACWVGMQEGGIAFYCRQSREVWSPKLDSSWHWGQINDILPLGKGKAWAATEDGYLVEMTTNDLETVKTRAYRFEGKMRKLVLGRSGIIWIATSAGMTMIADEYMMYLPVTESYALTSLRTVVCDNKNNVWYSQDNKLYTLSLSRPAEKPRYVYTAMAGITALHADASGNLWIGTFGAGLYRRNNRGDIKKMDNIPMLQNESVLDINSHNQYLWVSGLNGVAQLQYDTVSGLLNLARVHNKNSGAGSDYIYQVYPDSKDRVWMATDGGGVVMYKDNKYQYFNEGIRSKVAYTIAEDATGNIWASTLNDGLYFYNNKTWSRVGTSQGLQDVNIHTIAPNATGQVVIVNDNGVDVWYPFSRQFRNYSPKQGLHLDSTSTVLKLYARDTAGNVLLPFKHGFIIFKNIHAPFDISPNVHIETVSMFFKPVALTDNNFSHSQNHISISYEGINFANPDKLHYRYKLEGYNDSWIVTNDEAVTFPQLSPGKYTFRVQASLSNHFGKHNEAVYSFVITKPFWRTPWFLLLFSAAVFGVVYTYIVIREKNLRKLSLLQRERMMFEYEHLKSQVNPHFLFNSLNTLASLIEEDKDIATKYTTHLSDLYRNMLSHRNKDLVLLSEEWDILENYLYIQKSRFGNSLVIEKDIPVSVMETKKIIPLALQMLVENALKHNVASQSRPLTIRIKADEETITIRNTLNPKLSKEKGAGLGLKNIQKRYSLLTDKSIYYGVSDTEYVVNLPLL